MTMNMRILCAGEGELMRVRYVSPSFCRLMLVDGILTDGWSCCGCLVVLFPCLLFLFVVLVVFCFCGGWVVGVVCLRSFPCIVAFAQKL